MLDQEFFMPFIFLSGGYDYAFPCSLHNRQKNNLCKYSFKERKEGEEEMIALFDCCLFSFPTKITNRRSFSNGKVRPHLFA